MVLLTIAVSVLVALTEFCYIIVISPMSKPSMILRFLPDDIAEVVKENPEPEKWTIKSHLILICLNNHYHNHN